MYAVISPRFHHGANESFHVKNKKNCKGRLMDPVKIKMRDY